MTTLGFILADGGGDAVFWGIVVILAIISKIIKASKKAAGGQGPQQEGPAKSAEAELQKFLESLGGVTKPPPPVPPRASQTAPPPPAVPAAPRVQRGQKAVVPPPIPRPPIRKPARKPAPRQTAPMPAPKPERKEVIPAPLTPVVPSAAYARRERKRISASMETLRMALGDDLVDKQNLRKAILLSEILGTPLGARPASQAGSPR